MRRPKKYTYICFFSSPACNKGKMVCHHEVWETDPSKYPSEQFPTLLAHHGCGLFRWLGCATRRFHLGTDESRRMFGNQAGNKQHTETFVLIHAWRCSVEWMDGKVATLCESIFEWDATRLLDSHCFSCYLRHLRSQRGWCGCSGLYHVCGARAGYIVNVRGPIRHCLEKPRLGTNLKGAYHVPVSRVMIYLS